MPAKESKKFLRFKMRYLVNKIEQIVLATGNQGKVTEIEKLLKGIKILSLKDFTEIGNIIETGKSFEENALIKAKHVFNITRLVTISDDSGLVVPALNNSPGIYSARYAGENASDEDNIQKLIKEIKKIPSDKRDAYFYCCAAICTNSGCKTFSGRINGIIITEPVRGNGFGYDPIFYLPKLDKTMSELTKEEKNKISHRGIAFKKIKEYLFN